MNEFDLGSRYKHHRLIDHIAFKNQFTKEIESG
jgi:hypothetical protein